MKIWLFRVIALLIPLVFFAVLEIGLRISGYGHVYPLFIENPEDPSYSLPRPDLVKRYFPNTLDVPTVSIEANFFRTQKPANGLRFVVQGGSSAAGFPYGFGASIAGMLDHRLKQSFPSRYVETINTSLAAVNSYTNLDTVDEIITQQPDGVLIYMGHNEYLGILGVGSNYTTANSSSATLLYLKLKEFRTFQLMQNTYAWFTKSENKPTPSHAESRTFMAKVAKHKNIPFDSEIYHQGLLQFEQNLGLMLAQYQQANIPVFIATLTSNMLDQAPFSSETIPAELLQLFDQLAADISVNKTTPSQYEKISKQVSSSQNADANFRLGRLFYTIDQVKLAKKHLLLAKDYDLLRFRAPEAMNKIIRNQALAYDAQVVEAQQRFEQRSKHGIVGNNLMLEHLHPNIQGYFLLSDAFYQSLASSKRYDAFHNVDTHLAWRQRGVLPSEEFFGFAKVAQLKSDYPFVETRTPLAIPKPQGWEQQLGYDFFMKKIDWLTMVQMAQREYVKDNQVSMIIKTQLMLADALPYHSEANSKAADILIGTGQKQRATTYNQRTAWAK